MCIVSEKKKGREKMANKRYRKIERKKRKRSKERKNTENQK